MRSEDELLEIIHRRAAELKAARRRRINVMTTLSVSVVLALAVTVVIAPSDGPPARVDVINGDNATRLLPGRWVPIAYSAPIVPPEGVYLEFQDDGSLTGYDGCNSFGAQWAANGDRLHVTEIQAHKMACPTDRDTRLIHILDDDPTMDTFDDQPGTLELRSESGFVAFSPEDPATPDAQETSTTPTTIARAPVPTEAPTTTADVTPPCPIEALTMSAALDSETYQPGDVIHITVTLSNASDTSCSVTNKLDDVTDPVCGPTALVHHGFEGDETEPQYNLLLGPFNRAACEPREIVPSRGVVTAVVDAPFDADPPYFLRAGTWTVAVDWGDTQDEDTQDAITTFECPEPGCRKGSFDDPQPE